jgi:hypothetical protein
MDLILVGDTKYYCSINTKEYVLVGVPAHAECGHLGSTTDSGETIVVKEKLEGVEKWLQ